MKLNVVSRFTDFESNEIVGYCVEIDGKRQLMSVEELYSFILRHSKELSEEVNVGV